MKEIALPDHFKEIQADSVQLPKAYDFYRALLNIDYSEFVSAHKDDIGNEIIVYETEPEVGQNPHFDIRYREKLFVLFETSDNNIPWVYSLRHDFPEVPHLNASNLEYPKCLCIYEEPYQNLKHNWRSIAFIERIRQWLSLTSRGELHQEDQPLEPFMLNIKGRLILPPNYDPNEKLSLLQCNVYKGITTILGTHDTSNPSTFLVLDHVLNPQLHNVVRYAPQSLFDLDQLLKKLNIDFIQDIFKPWLKTNLDVQDNSNFNHYVIILLTIPKLRNEQDQNPTTERIGFILFDPFIEICKKVRLVGDEGGQLGLLLFEKTDEVEVRQIQIAPLSIYEGFTPYLASTFNGIFDQSEVELKIGLVGCGAIGSQFFMNLVRSGYYKWLLIDNDVLLPHNLARHSLHSFNVGGAKTESLALFGNTLLGNNQIQFLQEDYLKPHNQEELDKFLPEVEVLLDMSASIPVARKLSIDPKVKSRVISIFLNPRGSDLVILAEPADKSIKLTELEASYYKMICDNELLHNHIADDIENIRYSSSCRDISSIMQQDHLSILSGIASKIFKELQKQPKSKIGIWSIQENVEIKSMVKEGEKYRSLSLNNWQYRIAESAIQQMLDRRADKLPKETGGILLGFVDFKDSITYIVDIIPSPPDSKEYPTAYYRGISGVHEKLENIYKYTHGNIYYLGEWHSHPSGCSLRMSDDDKKLFTWIEDHLSSKGYPPLMIIVGDNSKFEIHNQLA